MDKQNAITGLVLAGGRGQRMGGVDKVLQLLNGRPLVAHVLERLSPQVDSVLISANRHLDQYAAFGVPVLTDEENDFKGPLAGLLAGLSAVQTDWLVCSPCDTPHLPLDLVVRLVAHLVAQRGAAQIVLPRSEDGRLQPLFALMHRSTQASLAEAIAGGQRRVTDWMLSQNHRVVDMPGDFSNVNSASHLQALHG